MIQFLIAALVAGQAPAAELDKLQGTWVSEAGIELLIKGEAISVWRAGDVEFGGTVAVDPKAGRLRFLTGGGEVAIEATYRIEGNGLRLEIDGRAVDYKRRN